MIIKVFFGQDDWIRTSDNTPPPDRHYYNDYNLDLQRYIKVFLFLVDFELSTNL